MNTQIPAPPTRVLTRYVLPVTLVAGAAAALAWTGWRSFLPVPTVEVVPVSVRAAAVTDLRIVAFWEAQNHVVYARQPGSLDNLSGVDVTKSGNVFRDGAFKELNILR